MDNEKPKFTLDELAEQFRVRRTKSPNAFVLLNPTEEAEPIAPELPHTPTDFYNQSDEVKAAFWEASEFSFPIHSELLNHAVGVLYLFEYHLTQADDERKSLDLRGAHAHCANLLMCQLDTMKDLNDGYDEIDKLKS